MFCRYFACELFVHGIGGAKYDQLGDDIAAKFLGVNPPEFMTASATMKLPFEVDSVSRQSITHLKQQLRKLRFHPETLLPNDQRTTRKRELVIAPPQSGSRKSWHDEIDAINLSLFDELASKRRSLEGQISESQEKLPVSNLVNSREYSFALFPEQLIGKLKELAKY